MLSSKTKLEIFASSFDDVTCRGLSLVSSSSNGSGDTFRTTSFVLLHPLVSTIMTDLEPVNRVELARGKCPMEIETPMVKVNELHSSSEISNSKIPAIQSEDKSKEKVCGVCNDHEARYKCSRCQLP